MFYYRENSTPYVLMASKNSRCTAYLRDRADRIRELSCTQSMLDEAVFCGKTAHYGPSGKHTPPVVLSGNMYYSRSTAGRELADLGATWLGNVARDGSRASEQTEIMVKQGGII